MDKHLVPFNFQAYRTTEAVWDINKRDTIKMFRITRRGIGEFLTPESKRPQKIIDKIIERNPHLRESSVAVIVTATDGKKYLTETYDIWGIYQISVESGLPRAKEFLRRFPILLEALQNRTIKPPAIGDIKPEVLVFFGVKWKERGKYQLEVCTLYSWSKPTFYRKFKSAALMLGIPQATRTGRPRKTRADKGSYINSEEHQRVITLYNQNKNLSKKEVARIAGVDYSKVTRWTRTA